MKKSPETFAAICEAICNSPSYANAARAVGIGEATLWRWIGLSQNGDSDFVFEWMGEQVPLHVAMKSARKMAAAGIIQNLEHRALHGDNLQSFYKGQPQWQLDPALFSWSDDELQALGMDRYQRDEKGKLIPVIIHTPPPVALALAVASAHYPKMYGNHSEVTVNNRNSGVTTVKHVYGDKAKALPAPVEILAPPIATTDDDLSDLLGEEPIEAGEFSEEPSADSAEFVEAAAEPVASPPPQPVPEPAPPAPTKTDARFGNMTPEQMAILGRLRANAPASVTQPSGIVEKFSATDADDYSEKRTGRGPSAETLTALGGTKMV
jgi:hypothetical protein